MNTTAESAPQEFSDRGPGRWLVLLIALFLGLTFLGSRALWEPSETRYAEVTREMVAGSTYLAPTLHGEPHFTKPPLAYWLGAPGQALLGATPWGARVHLALVFVLTALLVGGLGARLYGRFAGRWAGVVWATMLVPYAASGVLTSDAPLVLLLTAGVYAFWRGWQSESRGWLVLAWGAFGLGFLCKGPPALLPLAALVALRLLLRRGHGGPRVRLVSLRGLLLFLLLGGGWYALVLWADPGLWRTFFVEELWGRVAAGDHVRNASFWQVFRLYVPILTLGAAPWLWLYVLALRRTWRREFWTELRERPDHLLLLLWIVVPCALLFASQSKMWLYVLPLTVPLALALTGVLVRRVEEGRPAFSRLALVLLGVWVLALPGLRYAAEQSFDHKSSAVLTRFVAAELDAPRTELVAAGRVLHGPAFLLGRRIENTTVGPARSLDRQRLRPVEAELAELGPGAHDHVFLVDERQDAAFEERRATAGVSCRKLVGPSRHRAYVCAGDPHPPARLLVAIDEATNAGDYATWARTLRALDGARRLDALLVAEDAAAIGAWRRRVLYPSPQTLLWPLGRPGSALFGLGDDGLVRRPGLGGGFADEAEPREPGRAAELHPELLTMWTAPPKGSLGEPDWARLQIALHADPARWQVLVLRGDDTPPPGLAADLTVTITENAPRAIAARGAAGLLVASAPLLIEAGPEGLAYGFLDPNGEPQLVPRVGLE